MLSPSSLSRANGAESVSIMSVVEYYGALAEWLRRGLQNPVHRFNSGRRLQKKRAHSLWALFFWASSSTLNRNRFVHAEHSCKASLLELAASTAGKRPPGRPVPYIIFGTPHTDCTCNVPNRATPCVYHQKTCIQPRVSKSYYGKQGRAVVKIEGQ